MLERGADFEEEEEPSTSGRPFKRPYGGAAAHGSWSEQHLGLAAGLGKDAVLWALLSESHEALLSLCAASVRPGNLPLCFLVPTLVPVYSGLHCVFITRSAIKERIGRSRLSKSLRVDHCEACSRA